MSEPQMNNRSGSLYEAIVGAIQSDGTLPRDFSLPREENEDPKALRFADGAKDGISLYHMAPDKRDIKPLTEVVGLIAAGSFDAARECLRLFFSMGEFTLMLPLIDDLQEWIVAHKDAIDPEKLYAFCVEEAKTGAERERVKFALACLELLNTGADEGVRNLVRVLALSDEFTLYALFLMRQWPDGNALIFDTAQHVSGWGRIHAVERLEPDTAEIRRWLLREGWQNNVMAAYSALTCLEKSGVIARMAEGVLEEDDYASLTGLLPALLEEGGPVAGIGALENAPAFLAGYLDCAEQRAASLVDYNAVLALQTYCAAQEPPLTPLAGRCAALLDRPACRDLAERAAETGEDLDFAKAMGVDVTARVLTLLGEDYRAHYALLYLLHDSPAALKQAAALAESALPLDALSTGAQDERGFGPEYALHHALGYTVQFLDTLPGTGEALVAAALNCPVTNCRASALRTLAAWKQAGYGAEGAVMEALSRLRETEENKELKQQIKALS